MTRPRNRISIFSVVPVAVEELETLSESPFLKTIQTAVNEGKKTLIRYRLEMAQATLKDALWKIGGYTLY